MDVSTLNAMTAALAKAKEEQSKANYLEDCGSNAGIRKMNANKSEWLRWVVYLAEYGLEQMTTDKECAIAEVSDKPNTDFKRAIEFFKNIKNNF